MAGTLLVADLSQIAVNYLCNCTLNEQKTYQEVNKYLSISINILWACIVLLMLARVSDQSRGERAECPCRQLCLAKSHPPSKLD